ncbi:hypothetical protein F4778DRAFT_759534 [Xylariomycetidae sp. FL2044]|nr:hypothetical protein F4778DRAFT_759534 [Xylariomycetidae sp. FL2044]
MNLLCRSQPLRATSSMGIIQRASSLSRPSTSQRQPPMIRHGTIQGRRSFSAAAVAATAMDATQQLFLNLHSITHTPWFLTIPLIAIGVNAIFRLPLNLYTQTIIQRRNKHVALLQASMNRIQRNIDLEMVSPSARQAETEKRSKKMVKGLYGKMGLSDWKLRLSWLSFPAWFLAIDGLRRLCGGPPGLFTLLFMGKPGNEANAVNTGASPSAAAAVSSSSSSSSSSADIIAGASTTHAPATSGIAELHSNLAEPSLITEGCLWFPDLTAADPLHILPFAVSAMLVVNLAPRTEKGWRTLFQLTPRDELASAAAASQHPMLQRTWNMRSGFRLGLMAIAAMVGPITMNLPAALHLYWLSSGAAHWVFDRILNYWIPTKTPSPEKCKGFEMSVIRPRRKVNQALN